MFTMQAVKNSALGLTAMPMGTEHPQCSHGKYASDREHWAPLLLATEWQSPAKTEKGKLVKSNVQEDDTGLMLSGSEGAVSLDWRATTLKG